MESAPNPRPEVAIVAWIIWFSILSGLMVIQFVVGGGVPGGEDKGSPQVIYYAITAGVAMVALGIRTLVLPNLREIRQKMSAMIIGVAISESIGIICAIAVDKQLGQTRLVMFATSVCCILAYAPYYMKPGDEPGSGFREG